MGISRHQNKIQSYNCIAFRILLALVWTQYTFLNVVKAVIVRIPFFGQLSEIFIPVCIILATMVSIPWFLKRVNGKDALFYVSLVLLVLFTMIFFPKTQEYLTESGAQILISSALFYFVGVSYSFSNCSRDLFYCSLLSIFSVLILRLYQLRNGAALEADDMDMAYKLLPSAMYLIYYASYKKRTLYWGFAVSALLIMFIFGTRGPILCMLVYFAAIIGKKAITVSGYKRVLLIICVLAGILFLVVNQEAFTGIIKIISKLFGKIGFSSRIFDFYLAGDVAESQGRENLAKWTWAAIVENPVAGYGFTADRYLFGVYPHNFILEFWCHYGVIIGTLFMAVLFIITAIAHLRTLPNSKVFNFLLMLACMVYIKLLCSSSYSIEPYFYFMLGVYISVLRKTSLRKRRHTE